MVLCVFIDRETHNFILKFREIFHEEKQCSEKSDENQVFCQICAILGGGKLHFVIHRYFSLFLKGFEDIFLPDAITDSPFK